MGAGNCHVSCNKKKMQSKRLKEITKNGKTLTEGEVKEANKILYDKYLDTDENGVLKGLEPDSVDGNEERIE